MGTRAKATEPIAPSWDEILPGLPPHQQEIIIRMLAWNEFVDARTR